MAQNSAISWTDHTLNFWQGCKKISIGCLYCYMYRDKEKYGQDPRVVVEVSQHTQNAVLKSAKPGDKIFVCSWSDFFIAEADQWRTVAWDKIRSRPDLIFQILTKRPERIKDCLPADWGTGWDNVWLGVSCENQDMANERIPILLSVPAKVRWLSCEPLLSAINLLNCRGINWVVVGAESGNDNGNYRYRPCELQWIEAIVDTCKRNQVPVWVKQMGTHLAKELKLKSRHGTDINEFPKHLQIQQFPIN